MRRWDALGRAWKWMSGSPDADDLEIINKELNKITDNSNKQININSDLYKGVNNVTETVNKLIVSNEKTNSAIDLLNIIMNLDILNDEISNIHDSILLAKLDLINSKLLSHREIELIGQILRKQGIALALLDEALGFATTTIGTNGEIILYVINIPHFGNLTYQHLKIEPVISNSQRIKLDGSDYLYGHGKLFIKSGICRKLGNWSLCNQSDLKDISEESCIFNIISGRNSKCNYEKVVQHQIVTEMSQTTLLLNDVNDTLRTTCGIANRNLTGSFLITYQNCSVSIRDFSFTNEVLETINQPVYLPSIGLEVTKNHVEYAADIHTLHKLHVKNLEHLEKLQLTSSTHHWTIIGGLSSSSTIMFLFIFYILFRIRRPSSTVAITEAKANQQQEVSSRSTTFVYQPPSLGV